MGMISSNYYNNPFSNFGYGGYNYGYSGYGYNNYGRVFTVRRLGWRDLLFGQGNWLNRALVAVGVIAVLGFLLFVALPVVLVLVGVAVAVWLVMHLIMGN